MNFSISRPPAATPSPRKPRPRDAALVRRYKSAALECLRQGKQRGWNDLETLEIDPDLEPIRETPEFQALLAEFRKSDEKTRH